MKQNEFIFHTSKIYFLAFTVFENDSHGSGEVEVVVSGMFTGFEGYHSLPEVISFPKMYVI